MSQSSNARRQKRVAWFCVAPLNGIAAVLYWLAWAIEDSHIFFAILWTVLAGIWIATGFFWRSAEVNWAEVDRIREQVRRG